MSSISWYIVGDEGGVFHTESEVFTMMRNGLYPRAAFSFESRTSASKRLSALRKAMPGVKATVMDRAGLFKTLGRTDPQPDAILFHDRERATPLKLYRLEKARLEHRRQFERARLSLPPGNSPVVV